MADDTRHHFEQPRSLGTSFGIQLVLILMLLFVYTATRPPDVNESHYLTKAKHYWQPEWCGGDLFLESGNAHVVFYAAVGWLTQHLSLAQTAWVARFAAWLLLAIGWLALNRALMPRTGIAPLTLAVCIVLWEVGDLAGEWVVGGVEGKVFAYGFVFLALASMVANKWSRVWIYLGFATAFHVLVGGWCVLAALLVCGREFKSRPTSFTAVLMPLSLGAAIAMLGIVPALTLDWGTDPKVVSQAHRIYVFDRLPHHLFPFRMSIFRILSYLAAVTLWIFCWRSGPRTESLTRLHRLTAATVGFAATGVLISLTAVWSQPFAAGLLRFYWFRLSDVMVPVAVTLSGAVWLTEEFTRGPRRARQVLALTVLIITLSIGGKFITRHLDGRPAADVRGPAAKTASWKEAQMVYTDWRALCDWARNFTPPTARFLTPTASQTFKWYAHRAELVTRKDIPQDAESVVRWRRIRGEVGELGLYGSDIRPPESEIRELAGRYLVQYVVVTRKKGDPSWDLPLVYRNSSFAIYRIPAK